MRIIGGTFKNRSLNSPKSECVRPTLEKLRACLFNICQNEIHDAAFLDIFAGSGAMGLEAISRGAAYAAFIESDKLALKCIKENIEKMNVECQTQVYQGDAFRILSQLVKQERKFDIIYSDPPYKGTKKIENSFVLFNHILLKYIEGGGLLKPNGRLFLEDSIHHHEAYKSIEEDLKTLHLKSSRSFGGTSLREYYPVKF